MLFSSFQFRQYWYCIWWPTEEVPFLAWERGFSEIQIPHKYRHVVQWHIKSQNPNVKRFKRLQAEHSQEMTDKGLKKSFFAAPKTSEKKAFDYPIVYRINAKVWYCWMSWALKRCMIWVSAMLHDPWRMPKETDPWYWYSRLYIISICYILGCTNSCWDRLNSIKPGPGRLQFLRWASMWFFGSVCPFRRYSPKP